MAQASAPPPFTVPGPVDRESFFAAQRRHRRAARWYGWLTIVGVLLVGVPLSVLLTPMLLMITLAVLHLTAFAASIWTPEVLVASMQWLVETLGPYLTDPQQRRIALAVGVPLTLVAPGALAQALLYLRVRRLFRRAGVAGLLAEIGAREPDQDDPQERQLCHVVEEMGLAAGLRPPRVMIVDTGPDGAVAAGAAVLGTSPDHATLVVGRSYLDRLDRDATQAVVAYLVASAGNGDLQINTATIAARMTTHAVEYVLESPHDPVSASVRRALLRPVRRREQHLVHDLLATLRTEHGGQSSANDSNRTGGPRPSSTPRLAHRPGILSRLLYFFVGGPFGLTGVAYTVSSSILWALFMKPWQSRFLRARSAHADAAAVQLMRLADPLAQAVATAAADLDATFAHGPNAYLDTRATGAFREMTGVRAGSAATGATRVAGLGGGWPIDLSLFVGSEARRNSHEWIRRRPEPGVRRWRLWRLGANVKDGVTEPRPLVARLALRTLAAPFVVIWYALGLGTVAFLMSMAIFIGVLVFSLVYSCVIGTITTIPTFIDLARTLLDNQGG